VLGSLNLTIRKFEQQQYSNTAWRQIIHFTDRGRIYAKSHKDEQFINAAVKNGYQ
jgi:hypothetical protein